MKLEYEAKRRPTPWRISSERSFWAKLLGGLVCLMAMACTTRPVPSEAGEVVPLLNPRAVVVAVCLGAGGALTISWKRWPLVFMVTMAGACVVWALTHFWMSY
jgi:hypothetical protein